MILRRQAGSVLVNLLADGDLVPRDVVVLLQLVCRIHSRTGAAQASCRDLAAETGSSVNAVAHSLRRLRLAGLVVKAEGPRQRPSSYCISPAIGANGTRSQRARSEWVFSRALKSSPPPTPPTPAAVKARQALPEHLPAAS